MEIFVVVCQIFVFYINSKIIIGDIRITKKEFLYLLICCVLSTYSFTLIGVYASIINVLLYILLHYIRLGDIINSIFVSTYGIILGLIADHFVTLIEFSIFGAFEEVIFFRIITWSLISIIISYICYLIIEKIKYNLNNRSLSKLKLFATILGGFTLIAFYVSIFMEVELGNTYDLVKTNFIFFIIYSLLTVVILFVYMRVNRQHQKIKEKQIEFQALQNYTQSLEQSYNTLRKFRHDYKNLLISLDSLLDEGDLAAIQKFIKQDMQVEANKLLATRNNLDDLSKLNISPLKGLILAKLWQVNPQKIEVKLEINQPVEQLKMEPIDCVKVVGILLDNAIEAVQEVGSGQIRLTCFQLQHSVHLIIDNTYVGEMIPTNQLFQPGFSTKGQQRGLGLANVREIIAQYPDVSIETQIKGQIFSQHLIIPA
ncbi:GHKL domain-containing protein [Ignavigranum ruoffiae]|uniref:sensor histidine kinase n=1 Tax=Ignavigranum ruoffiae TaxID=89093 RepID=UPI00205850FE|nr:GHKL domain-containing protein [Ignavigranum ruoffiae]UPQ86121.1 GHKL domain-containing protein [Ignavigranum ruoffiae]